MSIIESKPRRLPPARLTGGFFGFFSTGYSYCSESSNFARQPFYKEEHRSKELKGDLQGYGE
ncbi:hypothetical protein D3H55_19435 [Bacillus salacetis]|uniref:Uncharacterized protein n=1 Tax=Bacillus salacetis TaxID=2315464 RepID=A0A3A1QU11_9BACI|nr:hypothetical protein [Bacillus salacetis]RIW29301.1 hypothetical protein D3H55_19435 [Bacillus salacetis]